MKTYIDDNALALYCLNGRWSKLAISKLNGLEIEIYELNKGFLKLQQAGFPIITNNKQ